MPSKIYTIAQPNPSNDLIAKFNNQYSTILADPPWQFQNRTGKMAPKVLERFFNSLHLRIFAVHRFTRMPENFISSGTELAGRDCRMLMDSITTRMTLERPQISHQD